MQTKMKPTRLEEEVNRVIRNIVIVTLVLMLVMIGCTTRPAPPAPAPPAPAPTPSPRPTTKVTIQDFRPISDVRVDTIYFREIEVVLKNEGDLPLEIKKLIVVSNTDQLAYRIFATLQPGEEKTIPPTFCFYLGGDKIAKDVGVDSIEVTLKVIGYTEGTDGEQTLAETEVAVPIPIARIGDTITEYGGTHDLALTLLWWKESSIAVFAYSSGYYTFTARPGMKFIILAYKFQNNWIREQETPYLSEGEIATAPKGYCYELWSPPAGVGSKEYNPREARAEEVKSLIGDSGGFVDLLPEESVIGRVVFEIPEDAMPIEASIVYLPLLVRF